MRPLSSTVHQLLMTGCTLLFSFCVSASTCLAQLPAPKGAPIPQTPEFTNPEIQPTLGDWLLGKPLARECKISQTDPLQRPAFAGAPVDSLKGMAAGIKAVELDAPNRIRAAQYLGTLDCVTYPQAQDMLIQVMQEDPIEDVRYEAVMALRMMLTRSCVNLDGECDCDSCKLKKKIAKESKSHSKKAQHECPKNPCELVHQTLPKILHAPCKICQRIKKGPLEATRYDCCRGCCNEKVLNALSRVAYETDEFGCCVEPSARVREAAAMGLNLCCNAWAPPMQYVVPTVPPIPVKEETDVPQRKEETIQPPATDNNSAKVARPIRQVSSSVSMTKSAEGHPKTIPAIGEHCIVGLKARQFEPAKAEFRSVFEERTYFFAESRTYFFASAAAKAEFDRNPTAYAVAYGGLDPVDFIESRTKVDGQYLREYEGRFYLFATKENWEAFKAKPSRYQVSN